MAQRPPKRLKLTTKADYFKGHDTLRDAPSSPSDEISLISRSAPSSPSSIAVSVLSSIPSLDVTSASQSVPSSPSPSSTATAPLLTSAEVKLIKSYQSTRSWLQYITTGMYCTVCTRLSPSNHSFIASNPCNNIRKQVVVKHEESKSHEKSIKLAVIQPAIDVIEEKGVSKNRTAMRHKVRMVHWLANEEIANLKFQSLQQMVKGLGVTGLNLDSSRDIDYSSPDFVVDMLSAMSKYIRDQILAEINTVNFIAVLMDETTDVTATKQMCIYVRYVLKGVVKTPLLGLVDLPQADAHSIVSALFSFFQMLNIPTTKVVAVGSDGASTFTGKDNGVCALMKQSWNPMMTSYHCMAHKLNLASEDAVHSTPCIEQHLEIINSVYVYFSHSSKRTNELENIQRDLKIKIRHLIRPTSTRWLSHDMAVDAVHYLYPALILYFSKERTTSPTAEFIFQSIFSTQFVHLNMLLNELLEALAILSRMFQDQNVDLQSAQTALDTTTAQIKDIQNKTDRYKDVNLFIELMYSRHPSLSSLPSRLATIDMTTHISWQRSHGTPFISRIRENLKSRFPKDRLLPSFAKVMTRTHTHANKQDIILCSTTLIFSSCACLVSMVLLCSSSSFVSC